MKYSLFVVAALTIVGFSFAATSATQGSCSDYCIAGGKEAMNATHLLAMPEIKTDFGDTQEDADKKANAMQKERYTRYCAQSSADQPGNLFWCKRTCVEASGGIATKIINNERAESIAKFISEREDACKTLGFLVGR